MAKKICTARDCLPFEFSSQNIEKDLETLCKSFELQNGESEDYEPIAVQRYDSVSQSFQWLAGRYIGLAYIGGTEISIRPRFGENILLAILADVYNIKYTIHNASPNFSPDWFSSLLNILQAKMWVERCAQANRYGLPHTNVKKGYQGVSIKGALDIPRTITSWMTRREVCTNIFEKTFDDTICRIVHQAYLILSKKRITKKVKKEETKVGFGYSLPPAIQDTINTLNSQYKGQVFDITELDYQRIRYKSIYLSWKPLVDFSWSVIKNRQIGYNAADKHTTDCVFVDMAEIWEAFLRKKLAEGFADTDWRVLSVDECTYTTYKGTFYQRNIIPDIILGKEKDDGTKEYMVFDAKYKRMRGKRRQVKDSDIDRSDFFQIHTYIEYVNRCIGKVIMGGLLYPLSEDITQHIESYSSENLFINENPIEPHPIKFIVDGVYCPEVDPSNEDKYDNTSVDELNSNVEAMIKRLKKYAGIEE